MLTHAGKPYESISEGRLITQVEHKIRKWQHDLRPERYAVDLVFELKMLMEKGWERDKKKKAL